MASHSLIQPNAWVFLRPPTGTPRLLQIVPNTTVSLSRYGNFPANLLIHRPYHTTYELQDKDVEINFFSRLRVVPASEIHADVIAEESGTSQQDGAALEENILSATDGVTFSLVDQETGEVVLRSNREIIDDNARQTLTWQEIEALKRDGTDSGQELIAKLMLSHTGMDQKTTFSMAKYKLLKEKKFLRRFTVLPVDISEYGNFWGATRDTSRIMDMRDEMLGLLGCWGNVHYTGPEHTALQEVPEAQKTEEMLIEDIKKPRQPQGTRYLVVDDTSGLLVGALAERMGVLYADPAEEEDQIDENGLQVPDGVPAPTIVPLTTEAEVTPMKTDQETGKETTTTQKRGSEAGIDSCQPSKKRRVPPRGSDFEIPYSTTNTITLVHSNGQANLTHLTHWGFDSTNPNHPPHPLLNHLLPLTWLQLLDPQSDSVYNAEAPCHPASEVDSWKAARRGNYHRKRRRWARTRYIVDSARAGGFSGLIVASTMDPISVLQPLVPLLEGGAPVAVYSPSIEPLAKLADAFSTARRAAFSGREQPPETIGKTMEELERWEGTEEFPINPTLLQGVQLQTSRARRWQVLPGRTHPVMTARGGSEGYVFTAWRAKPVEGRVEPRGKFQKKVVKVASGGVSTAEGTPADAGTPAAGLQS